MIRKLADVSSSNTYNNFTTSHLQIQNVSVGDKKHCFHLSTLKHQTLERLANIDVHMKSRLDKDMGMKLSNKSVNNNNLNQSGYRSKPCKRFVTLGTDYRGRTGNQMFQVASLVGTALRYDIIPIIPKWFALNRYFELPNVIDLKLNKLFNVVKCKCRKSAVFYNCTKEFNSMKNISLHGYLQSWKYFEGANDVIKAIFKFKTKHLFNANGFLSNVYIAGFQRVCIHIRHGDITSKARIDDGYVTAGLDFIEKAKEFYINKYSIYISSSVMIKLGVEDI
ncbi:uncharacterized protein LOC128549299 [Mercenaria mercenaria]|uniref:uncharacterized protein LOC128549299 n=1 Tax=Mercenaria mercenaria TaxID=6596 RepID=UPI00234E824F|nr:uncharacterized protein LOC128549299 [Mercenaria mercenaria]